MFEKILLATTASPNCDNAAKMAFDMQLKWETKLIILHVFGVHRSNYTPFGKKSRTIKKKVMDEEYAALVIEEMKHIYAARLKHAENVVLEAKVGRPDKEILKKAHEEDVDLIIMDAHTREEGVGPLLAN